MLQGWIPCRFGLVLVSLLMAVQIWCGTGAASAGEEPGTVYVINIGWHTGIAIRRSEIDPETIPEIDDLPSAEWIEFGWGDAEFYRNPDPAIATYLSAAFLDTPAVMHLVGMPVHPSRYFVDVEIVTVPLTEAERMRLLRFISDSFRRSDEGRAFPKGIGLYRLSYFYDAMGLFNLSNTCNTWVARAFAAAGLDIDADGVSRASTAVERLRKALAERAK